MIMRDDEGDGHKHDRGAAHVFLQVPGPDGDVHGHSDVSLQQAYYLLPLGSGILLPIMFRHLL